MRCALVVATIAACIACNEKSAQKAPLESAHDRPELIVRGTLLDEHGDPVADQIVAIGPGIYGNASFRGSTDSKGMFEVRGRNLDAFDGDKTAPVWLNDRASRKWVKLAYAGAAQRRPASAGNVFDVGTIRVKASPFATPPVVPACGPSVAQAGPSLVMYRRDRPGAWRRLYALGSFTADRWSRKWGAVLCIDVSHEWVRTYFVPAKNAAGVTHATDRVDTYSAQLFAAGSASSDKTKFSVKDEVDPGPQLERWLVTVRH